MRYIVKGIGVDAGLIMVGCMDYLKTVKSDITGLGKIIENIPVNDRYLGKIIDVPNGKYNVAWRIKETWNGDIRGIHLLTVTSGQVFICDPCYIIGKPNHEDWLDYLDETDFCNNLKTDLAFVIDKMGGDGEYEVELSFK
jgi:hypothetical protein